MRHFVKLGYFVLLVPLMSSTLWSNVQIVPTPQYLEVLNHSLAVNNGGAIEIVVGSPGAASSPKMKLAADFLREALNRASASVQVKITDKHPSGAAIHLWNWATGLTPSIPLNLLDRQTLSDSNHWGQSFIIRAPNPKSIWALGSSDQGVLLAAMTILQSIRGNSSGIEIPGVYVRDYPDFEFRAASDWLLNGEVNRWSLERGQGVEAFRAVCKHKLDRALRHKINMVLIDGFGWGLRQRFEG